MNDASASSSLSMGRLDDSSMKEKAQEATDQAQEKAQGVADKAQDSVRQQVDERTSQAGEKVSGTADDIRSVGEELRKQGKDGPAKLADRAAEETEKVGSYLSGNGPDQMLHDLEDFGRRRPWALLAGGLVAGAVAARFLKASSRSRYEGRTSDPGIRSRELSTNGAGTEPVGTEASPPIASTQPAAPAAPGTIKPAAPDPAITPGAVR